uniref:Uroplakin 3B n=1 Tax=Apteryx owenii TaxID=8824 RepID=A0A8B9QFM2_APTOW
GGLDEAGPGRGCQVLSMHARRWRSLSLLPYVPRVPRQALAGKVTATTFALDKPFCVFDGHADATDGVWLAVAFANASATFRNPASAADIPPYQRLRAALSYMTLEMPAAAYACPEQSAAVLRVGSDTTCSAERGPASCNGPLPSPGPYRVKFLALGSRGPKAETRWSEPIVLRQGSVPATRPALPVSGRRRHPRSRGGGASPPACRPAHPVPQPAAPAPWIPAPRATAAPHSSSPPSSPAWAPRWPWGSSAPSGTRGKRDGPGGPGRAAPPWGKEVEPKTCFYAKKGGKGPFS